MLKVNEKNLFTFKIFLTCLTSSELSTNLFPNANLQKCDNLATILSVMVAI